MISYRDFLIEAGGQAAGKLEIVKTSVQKARDYGDRIFEGGVDSHISDFDGKYVNAQRLASLGYTQRKDMPVITSDDVKSLQKRLQQGKIDIKAPFAPETDENKPFPESLGGAYAKAFLAAGQHDKNKKDDVVKAKMTKLKCSALKPIQQQIYFDKSINDVANFGVAASIKFMKSTSFVASADNYIIDGHHRWLAVNLLEPDLNVNVLQIDLPINILLPMTLAYGDAIGNKRNA